MRYTFRVGTKTDALSLVRRLGKRGLSADLRPKGDGQYLVSGRSDQTPAVEVESVGYGIRVLAFSTEQESS